MDDILDLFVRWMTFACFEIPLRLMRKSLWWAALFVVGAVVTVSWPFIGAYYSFDKFYVYTRYFCGFEVLFMLVMVREAVQAWWESETKNHGK